MARAASPTSTGAGRDRGEVTHGMILGDRAVLARSLPASDLRRDRCVELVSDGGLVSFVGCPWDESCARVGEELERIGGGVVEPLSDPTEPDVMLTRSLTAARRWSGWGFVVAVRIGETTGPAAAVVTAAMVAGARVLVLPHDSAEGFVRDVRRAADITEALIVERAG